MLIDSLMTNEGPSIYYNETFRLVIEDHLKYLREHKETVPIIIEPAYAYKYEGDLFGLLSAYNIPFEMHWIIMRINKMTAPTQTDDLLTNLLIPNKTVIERIKNVYMTKDRITN